MLEALKKSGMNVDKDTFANGGQENQQSSSTSQPSSEEEQPETPFSAFKGGKKGGGKKGSKGPDVPDFDIEIPFKDRLENLTRVGKIVLAVVAVLVLLVAYWWFHPPINLQSEDTWFFIVVVCVVLFLFLSGKGATEGFKSRRGKKDKADAQDTMPSAKSQSAKTYRTLSLVPIAVLVVGALGLLLSQSFFPGNAEKYPTILNTQNLDFAEDIQEVDYSQIPVIDRDTAIVLGNKEMGTIADYVSQFEVDDLYSQINYKGAPVRVSPLNYADLFKWLTNREAGIPAFAVVNMTTQDAEIVRLPEGQGVKYSQSEPLARNIDRYVQLKYPFYMFDEKSFEIDDDGHPWWICPVQKKTIGLFGGVTIDRVVLCDAVTGECQDLAVAEAPQWVDRVYPSELLIKQYNWYGALNNGWINSWLGQQGVVKTTPGVSGQLGYNYIAKDDDVWVYTGVTSATSDSSIIGFVLINQRTQESHFYSIAGATEASAMESAEGQVQNLRYTATFPILINVLNQPTYFMALKDNAGLVKKFAMIDIQRYQNVAVGDTVASCQEQYEVLLASNGVINPAEVDSSSMTTVSGVISRMAQAVIDGNSHFYVTLAGSSEVYDFPLPAMVDIVTYKEGDSIAFTYLKGETINTVQAISGAGATSAADTNAASAMSAAEAAANATADAATNTADSTATNTATNTA